MKDLSMANNIILAFQCMRTNCLAVHGLFCNFNIVDYHVVTYSLFHQTPFPSPLFWRGGGGIDHHALE
jgi:hypothetical protein